MIKMLCIVYGQRVRDLLHDHIHPPKFTECECVSFGNGGNYDPDCEYHSEFWRRLVLYDAVIEDQNDCAQTTHDKEQRADSKLRDITMEWFPLLLTCYTKNQIEETGAYVICAMMQYFSDLIFEDQNNLDKFMTIVIDKIKNSQIRIHFTYLGNIWSNMMEELLQIYSGNHDYMPIPKADIIRHIPLLNDFSGQLDIIPLATHKQMLIYDLEKNLRGEKGNFSLSDLIKKLDLETILPYRDTLFKLAMEKIPKTHHDHRNGLDILRALVKKYTPEELNNLTDQIILVLLVEIQDENRSIWSMMDTLSTVIEQLGDYWYPYEAAIIPALILRLKNEDNLNHWRLKDIIKGCEQTIEMQLDLFMNVVLETNPIGREELKLLHCIINALVRRDKRKYHICIELMYSWFIG
jgi:hypothetical protein